MPTDLEQLKRIIEEMRSERSRYKSHDLGYVDSVSASRVDEWADELESLLAAQPSPPQGETLLEAADASPSLCE